MMIRVWSFIIYLEQAIHFILNEELFLFAKQIPVPNKFLLVNHYKECFNFEIKIGDNLSRFSSLYGLPNKWQDGFELNFDTVTANNLCSNNPSR